MPNCSIDRTGYVGFSIFFAIVAWILAMTGNFYCSFVDVGATVTSSAQFRVPATLSYGFWSYQSYSIAGVSLDTIYYTKTCNGFGDIGQDTKWQSAKAFSIISVSFGVIIMILSCFLIGGDSQERAKRATMCGIFGYLLCTLFQGLTLLFLQSNACTENVEEALNLAVKDTNIDNVDLDNKCTMGWGAKCGIAATSMFFLAMVALCAASKQPFEGEEEQQPFGEVADEEEQASREAAEEEPTEGA